MWKKTFSPSSLAAFALALLCFSGCAGTTPKNAGYGGSRQSAAANEGPQTVSEWIAQPRLDP